jgi:hypothetical protein
MDELIALVSDDDWGADRVIAATRSWIERAVIGQRLCPFASQPFFNERVRYCVSDQRSNEGLLEDLTRELRALDAADPEQLETTLLIHPRILTDFLDYNDFLSECDSAIEALGLEGTLQVASFHPGYRFAGTHAEDITNYSNRSPYPMLHLLREASIARAVTSFPGVHDIGIRNIETLRRLGHEGWRRLWIDA